MDRCELFGFFLNIVQTLKFAFKSRFIVIIIFTYFLSCIQNYIKFNLNRVVVVRLSVSVQLFMLLQHDCFITCFLSILIKYRWKYTEYSLAFVWSLLCIIIIHRFLVYFSLDLCISINRKIKTVYMKYLLIY